MKHPLPSRFCIIALLILVALAGVGAAGDARSALKPFDEHSPAAIREAWRGRPFILSFWSLHCAPCKDDLVLLTGIQTRFPQVAILLVATDGPNEHAEVARYLAQLKPGRVETWAFADDFVERIRYRVDPEWRGELPRTYLFDADHHFTGHSGVLDPAGLERWLIEVTRRAPPPH